MKRRLFAVLLFAIVAALATSTLAYRLIAAHEAAPRAAVRTVLVASRDVAVGTLIQDSDVRPAEWPGEIDPHWLSRKEDIVGRGATTNINSGEPFADNRLAPPGAGAGLASIIPPGMRAAAVRVDEVVGVSGFVVPGMRVDILASGTPPGQYGTVTRTILQNIAVLSAGQNLERDAQGKPASVQSVNLLVTPEEAEKLSLASGQMKVQLVLRNPLDVTTVTTRGISGGDLLLDRAPAESKAAPRSRTVASRAPAAAPAPARTAQAAVPFTMEMIQGAKRETVVVGQAAEGVNGGGR
jgi:pilus assembly protein CpaB